MRPDTFSVLAGFLAGVAVMYYFDAASGRRRRALVRDKVVSAGHDAATFAEAKGRHLANQAKGVIATHSLGHRQAQDEPVTEPQGGLS